jgi:TolA-binding protein
LRGGLLLRNERRLLALCLQGLVEVALGQARPDLAVPAARTLWGVRELLDQPWKAHQAMLQLAKAQEASDNPGAAEATLTKALGAAQTLAPAGNVVPASAAAARTLTQLGQLLGRQGRAAEAAEWLSGAVDLAPDEETAAHARAALAALRAR